MQGKFNARGYRGMLGIMRKYKESIVIKVVFGVIVLSFIGTIFLVWGRGDQARKSDGSGFAAKVNGTGIPFQDFAREYDRMRKVYQQFGALTPELEKKLNVRKTVIDNMIDIVLIQDAAKSMGVKVSDDDLRKEISAIPYFQKDGAFDPLLYQQLLKGNRITPAQFEDEKRKEMLVTKVIARVKEKAQVTDADLQAEYHKMNDRISLAYASFSPADVKGEVKITEADLQGYLQSHGNDFRRPEEIKIAYVLADPSKVTGVTVTDEEINAFYQKNMDRYQGKGGILPLAEVRDKVKADSVRNKAAKQAYESAADALNRNLKTGDIAAAAQALKASVAETQLFTATTVPPAIAGEAELVKRAFGLKQGELGGPVETSRGIYLVKLVERKPAEVPPLAQVKGAVEARVMAEKAGELAQKKAQDALAYLGQGGAKLQETGLFRYQEKEIPRIGVAPELKEAAFALTSAAPVAKTAVKVGDKWYAVKLKERAEASQEEFQKNKDQIKAAILPKKQQEAVENWKKELRAKAKIEIDPRVLAD